MRSGDGINWCEEQDRERKKGWGAHLPMDTQNVFDQVDDFF